MRVTAKDIVRKALDILREGGICQGVFSSPNANDTMAHCSLGALRKAAESLGFTYYDYDDDTDAVAYLSAVDLLIDAAGQRENCYRDCDREGVIIMWNDDPERRDHQVYAAFEEAALDF